MAQLSHLCDLDGCTRRTVNTRRMVSPNTAVMNVLCSESVECSHIEKLFFCWQTGCIAIMDGNIPWSLQHFSLGNNNEMNCCGILHRNLLFSYDESSWLLLFPDLSSSTSMTLSSVVFEGNFNVLSSFLLQTFVAPKEQLQCLVSQQSFSTMVKILNSQVLLDE